MANFPDDDAPEPAETHLEDFPPAWKIDYRTYGQADPEAPRVLIYQTKALWTGMLYVAVMLAVVAVVVANIIQAIAKVTVVSPNLIGIPHIPALGMGAAVATIISGLLYAEISRFTENAKFFYFALHGLGTLIAAGGPFLMSIDVDTALATALTNLALGIMIGVAMHWVVPRCVIHPNNPLPTDLKKTRGN